LRSTFGNFLLLSAVLASSAMAQDEKLQCTKGGFGSHYLVPSAEAAKGIYRAVAQALVPQNWKIFPIIVVDDAGDHWEVSQDTGKPPPKPKPGFEIIQQRGHLNLFIDKCTGEITYASLIR
jgi:hypothetical protein